MFVTAMTLYKQMKLLQKQNLSNTIRHIYYVP